MLRRTLITSGLAAAAYPAGAATVPYLSISQVQVNPAPPPPKSDTLNALKGTLTFKFRKSKLVPSLTDGKVFSYGNIGFPASNECTSLIKRYAAQFGVNFSPTGNGEDCARFLTKASTLFNYFVNGSASFPVAGSVISTTHWFGQGLVPGTNRYVQNKVPDPVTGKLGLELVPGHVGIVQRADQASGVVTLFDQNMPIPNANPKLSGSWRTIEFKNLGTTKSPKWYGQMTNTGLKIDVVGWASPAS